MSNTDQTKTVVRSSYVVWTVLIVSLMLNALFIGFVIGKGGGPKHPPGGFEMRSTDALTSPFRVLRLLPRETRREVLQEIRPDRQAYRVKLRALRVARTQVIETIEADPFDADAYRAALMASKAAEADVKLLSIDLLVRAMDEISADERAIVAEKLRSFSKRPFGGKGERRPPEGDQTRPLTLLLVSVG